MELNIICPDCNNIFPLNNEKCNGKECNYSTIDNNQNFLINEAIRSFNDTISLKERNNFLACWKLIEDKIYFYPFIKEYLELAFYISISVGEYT